jgi:hypothetical protein
MAVAHPGVYAAETWISVASPGSAVIATPRADTALQVSGTATAVFVTAFQGYGPETWGAVIALQGYATAIQGSVTEIQGFMTETQGFMTALQISLTATWVSLTARQVSGTAVQGSAIAIQVPECRP